MINVEPRTQEKRIIFTEKHPKQAAEHFIGQLYRSYSEKASSPVFWEASSAWYMNADQNVYLNHWNRGSVAPLILANPTPALLLVVAHYRYVFFHFSRSDIMS